MNIIDLTVNEIKEKLENGEVTSEEITKTYINRIKEINPKINAYITLCENEALEKAKIIDIKYKNGEKLGKLAGIPIAIKDNICTKGIKTTCSSKILENFIPPYNATVIEKLENEGAIIIGKTNLDEFAMGTSTENSAFFITKNPWDLEKVPGGSSGGSAAAVASNMVPIALGSDTGGSVRQPSAYCSTVGLKPTYGRISRYGLVAYASSLDQIGIISKDVTDNALLLSVLAGKDEHDTTSSNIAVPDYTKSLVDNINGLKIGLPKEYISDGINEDVKKSILDAVETFKKLGATVEECSIPFAKYMLSTYYIIACAEASSNLGRFDGIRYGYRTKNYNTLKELYQNSRSEGFGSEVKRRILLGTYVLSSGYYDAYYKKAQKARTLLINQFKEMFNKYDLILTPTAPNTAFKIGTKVNDPVQMYLEDICTVPINVAGIPAISIPCGFDSNNMPIGMQLLGNHFCEETIYRAAYTFEKNTNWHKIKPNI